MTYRYLLECDDDDAPPIAAICDDCGAEIDHDLWEDCEIPHIRMAVEHACADCRAIGQREREEFEWTHARGRL